MSNASLLEELRTQYAYPPEEEIALIEKHDTNIRVILRKDNGGDKHFFILVLGKHGSDQDTMKEMIVDVLTHKRTRYKPGRKPCYWVKQGGDRNYPGDRIYAAYSFHRYPGTLHFFNDVDDFNAMQHAYGEVHGRYDGE